ncbi:hypothetical protein NW765_014290 [Fusarium oxysporum]|nr:hypothetical protein NW765_014290 [Fusarium oxysporum]
MRVFLIQTAKGLFSSSGGYKANNALLRYLSSRGHRVRQLCYSYRGEIEHYMQNMNSSGEHDPRVCTTVLHMRLEDGKPGIDVKVQELCMDDGVEALALDSEAFDAVFGGKADSPNQLARMSAEYIEQLSTRPSNFPFGPFAGGVPGHSSTTREADLFQQLDGIWSVSDTIRNYALEHGQLQTRFLVHHPWTYLVGKDHEMPTRLFNWDKKFVAMINPCPIKGSCIFVNLARACPQLEFLTYMSWGADDVTVKQMEDLPNMTVRPCCAIEKDLWRDIKVLVVPSLWCEAWGMVVVEAHLRGIPVVSSNSDALSESMIGLDYIIPVNPISGERDESGRYTVPKQDVGPWVKTITKLMQDRSEYERVSATVLNTTNKWLKGNNEADIETWLMGMRTGSNIQGWNTD